MQSGTIPLSRAAPNLAMPSSEPWARYTSLPTPPSLAPMPGPRIGTMGHAALGYQFAPGQGADTPGAGGAGVPGGMNQPVETVWYWNGFVVPQSKQGANPPGTVGWIGSRRSSP